MKIILVIMGMVMLSSSSLVNGSRMKKDESDKNPATEKNLRGQDNQSTDHFRSDGRHLNEHGNAEKHKRFVDWLNKGKIEDDSKQLEPKKGRRQLFFNPGKLHWLLEHLLKHHGSKKGKFLYSVQCNKCISQVTVNTQDLSVQPCNLGDDRQRWIYDESNGTIKNQATGECMTVATTNDGERITMEICSGTVLQQWLIASPNVHKTCKDGCATTGQGIKNMDLWYGECDMDNKSVSDSKTLTIFGTAGGTPDNAVFHFGDYIGP